jgi:hypothetical protein
MRRKLPNGRQDPSNQIKKTKQADLVVGPVTVPMHACSNIRPQTDDCQGVCRTGRQQTFSGVSDIFE